MDEWTCAHCGEVIGVYEPLVIELDGEPRLTSRAAEPDLPELTEAQFHRECHERRAGSSLG